MINPGDTLENPITGETMIFHETSAETGGQVVRVETIVRPDGFVAAAHVHPFQTERFDVLDGTVGFRVGKDEITATSGDTAMVPPGTAHKFWNAGETDARFIVEVRPALQFESLIETMFALAEKGKTNARGFPNPLQLAVIARAHFDTVRLPFPPVALQRAALAVGSSVGRALGYASVIERERTRGIARRYDRGRPHGAPVRRGAR